VSIIEIPQDVNLMSPDSIENDPENGGRREVFPGGFTLSESVVEVIREQRRKNPGKPRGNITEIDVEAWALLKEQFSYSQISGIVDRPPGTFRKKLSDLRNAAKP